ncbi:MAG: NAD(P)-dependent alcohol dehydrogenase [Phycisphaerae bacterium]|jgi:uncharacterized zinc-type alcohol dehydrogenase-like protein
MIKAYATAGPGQPLQPFEYEAGPLAADEVEIDVHYCGICHSDLSMIDNAWQMTQYPLVPGHEVIGRVAAVGDAVPNVQRGQIVGLGWYSRSCMTCASCLHGDHNLCARREDTIVGRHGGFANKVRAHFAWTIPLPAGVHAENAGPLFCGGITVFNPLVQFGVRPTDHVAVVGIGGLGHMALQFLRAWGCEITAFTSNAAKGDEARHLGAHHVVNSRDEAALRKLAGAFDFILVTVNVPLDWPAYFAALRPKGRLHFVGAVLEPVPTTVMALITGQKSVSGTPLGSPPTMATMLDFCARHGIAPVTQHFRLNDVNAALDHLRSGQARYRVVLDVQGG